MCGDSVNVFSIWRLQSIVETRAATRPTFDPSWYAATPILLSTMEVDLATVCASLPVFWPVLKKTLGPYIMVTHEVKITHESRQLEGDSHKDTMELQNSEWEQGRTMSMPGMPDFDGMYENSATSKRHVEESFKTIGRVTSKRVKIDRGTERI